MKPLTCNQAYGAVRRYSGDFRRRCICRLLAPGNRAPIDKCATKPAVAGQQHQRQLTRDKTWTRTVTVTGGDFDAGPAGRPSGSRCVGAGYRQMVDVIQRSLAAFAVVGTVGTGFECGRMRRLAFDRRRIITIGDWPYPRLY